MTTLIDPAESRRVLAGLVKYRQQIADQIAMHQKKLARVEQSIAGLEKAVEGAEKEMECER